MSDVVVSVQNVSKKFSRRLRHVMMYGAADIARNMIGVGSRSEALREGEFWAVDDVSFELKRGETLGIIGSNGSGKSTLLKMLNGIYMPDIGRIEIKGRVGALIEVGAGFHPMLTGRENIYINGTILGMSKAEIDRKFNDIVEFADIGDFVDSPVKHYSSGMFVRLGFAVAVHSEPDILLVDEVLAVGDLNFQAKCYGIIQQLSNKGVTTVLVSHSPQLVADVCPSSVLVAEGRLVARGATGVVLQDYYQLLAEQHGSGAAVLDDTIVIINDLGLLDSGGMPSDVVRDREPATFFVDISVTSELKDVYVNLVVTTFDKRTCLHVRLDEETGLSNLLQGEHRIEVSFPSLPLSPSSYLYSFRLMSKGGHASSRHFMQDTDKKTFSIPGISHTSGILSLSNTWAIDGATIARKDGDRTIA